MSVSHHRLSVALLVAVWCLQLFVVQPSRAAEHEEEEEAAVGPGKIGLTVETLTAQRAKDIGEPSLRGAEVKSVTRASPAERMGVAPGDIIVRVNESPVSSRSEVAAMLRDRWVGGATRLQIRRDAGRPWIDIVIASNPQPILRIDAGMHNAPIRRMSADREGRWLATASEDKTAKVWDLANGTLVRSLRPPVGDEAEGKLAAVAMSPDAAWVAVAGSTGMWGQGASVYVFERANGRLSRRLQGPPGVVEALTWSYDGQLLAVSFAGSSGARVYRTSNWESIGIDAASAAHVAALDFDRTNKLVTVGRDGSICVYSLGQEGGFRLSAKLLLANGRRANAARYSPDGALIAITYAGSTEVDVLRASDLKLAYEADTQSVRNGDLRSLAWSADGRTLFAAGRYVVGNRQVVRSWPDAGRGRPSDHPVATNSIFDLQGLPDGAVAFCTAEPAWGVLAANGQQRLSVRSSIPDFRGDGGQLQVSSDGRRIQFLLDRGVGTVATFDPDNGLSVVHAVEGESTVTRPTTVSPGLTITGWKDTDLPKLNGTPLRLQASENSRSLAISADGRSVVIGSDRAISKFDANGKLLGRFSAPGAAWAVNMSADGRFIIGGFADGTIRWYGANDGQEKLALFASSDGQRWVAWSPSGYYAASAAGEDLIGWQMNRGPDEAGDFFPASRFRSRFYRPDVLARILDTANDGDAFRVANQAAGNSRPAVQIAQALPLVVEPVSPLEDQFRSATVSIRFRIRGGDDAPLQGLRVRVNGGSVQTSAPTSAQKGTQAEQLLEVRLPMHDSTVELFAENRNGVSMPAVFKFAWRGTTPAKPVQPALPRLYVLAIGVSNYRDSSIRLTYPAKDAKDFVEALRTQQHRLYDEVQVVTLTNEQATRKAVLDNLARIKDQVGEGDVGVVFIAGHGFNTDDGTYYYLPFDFDPQTLDSAGPATSGVVYSSIREALAGMSGRAMLFIDTCHSGNVLGKSDLTSVVNDLTARENNVVVFASSTSKEFSLESDTWKNGAFTKALVAGLHGAADLLKDGKVMYTGLQYYLSRTVSTLTRGAQHPVVLAPRGVEDFIVAIP